MDDVAEFNFSISDLYPGPGQYRLNTCTNPDCSNFGEPHVFPATRRAKWREDRPDLSQQDLNFVATHGPGAYILAGTKDVHERTTAVLDFKGAPLRWFDRRSIQCNGITNEGAICGTKHPLLSPRHLDEEVERLRNYNGVLDGPACKACNTRFLDKPDEFVLNGAHVRTKDSKGKPLKRKATPSSIRLVHTPCRGKPGARFSVSLPHADQEITSDNLDILAAILNSAGIRDIQRIVGAASKGKTIGMSRIYNRILWLEEVFLSYEREMLRRWKEAVEKSGEKIEHRLSHDDLVLGVNWETATDRRNTQLNCSITADARSGYVYRIDVDFDPRVAPLDFFTASYLTPDGAPKDLVEIYRKPTGDYAVPKMSWQRPTGRLHEPQFFAACINELRAFTFDVKRKIPKRDLAQKPLRDRLLEETEERIALLGTIAKDFFGFPVPDDDNRGSFKGSTTRDLYTKAAHFILVKEILPPGKIVLTTEQEGTLPLIIPHIFKDEIERDEFAWLAMSFDKKAKKPERVAKVKEYRQEFRAFRTGGTYDGRFDPDGDVEDILRAFIADRMFSITADAARTQPFAISNYNTRAFPKLWVKSPTQASGEIDKIVGFPILPRHTRRPLKRIKFNEESLSPEIREELAEWVFKATLQPVSTFMNSVRERISPAARASSGGARLTRTYVQGAVFNPRTLIALLNIFRVYYNFFEPRTYASPYDEIDDLIDPPKPVRKSIKVPGTKEVIELHPRLRRSPPRATPAMRHGMDAMTKRKNGKDDPPDIHRILYRPWMFAGTKLGARFDASWATRSSL